LLSIFSLKNKKDPQRRAGCRCARTIMADAVNGMRRTALSVILASPDSGGAPCDPVKLLI
jgi:hypothetical protein